MLARPERSRKYSSVRDADNFLAAAPSPSAARFASAGNVLLTFGSLVSTISPQSRAPRAAIGGACYNGKACFDSLSS
jgi:hypothetical protein